MEYQIQNIDTNTKKVRDVKTAPGVVIRDFVNLYECEIGENSTVGTFVEIQKGVKVGSNCKISSHSFICEGVEIEDGVFIGHGVMFINDRFPKAVNDQGELQSPNDWTLEKTIIRKGASIGSGATIMCGIEIGENSLVGAGAVVTKSVPKNTTVVGNPAQLIKK